jgi:hypothetical protein
MTSDQRMLEISSQLHWLARGAFSAVARVLARAKQSSSGSLRESTCCDEAGLCSGAVDRVLQAAECLTDQFFHPVAQP